jgi:hypothetical protein
MYVIAFVNELVTSEPVIGFSTSVNDVETTGTDVVVNELLAAE